MKKGIKGFTLIELLIVVIIIGILAGIALPQYKKMTIKSHIAALKQTVAAARDAEERFYTANGTYVIDASVLDIGIQFEKTNDPSVFTFKNNFVIDLIAGGLSNSGGHRIDIYYCPNKANPWNYCATNYRHFMYSTYLRHSTSPGKTFCTPYTDLGTELCKMLK